LSILNKIIEQKRIEIKDISIEQEVTNFKKVSFYEKLKENKLHLISEVKQASPSKGIIYKSFNPIELATSFETNGASCISVLTDQEFFKGHINYLMDVKQKTSLPVLRKDFIIDIKQVKETKAIGADVMLLILDILDVNQANELIECAQENGIEILLEVHSEDALSRLSDIKSKPVVGVNNRNLNTFECNNNWAIEKAKEIKELDNQIKVIAESGYNLPNEMEILDKSDVDGVLIGEGLSKNKDLLEWFRFNK
jgi:indole-3-glycerol phosphate synthase